MTQHQTRCCAPERGTGRLSFDELDCVFRQAEKPRQTWRVGIEAEKFGVHGVDAQPLRYGDAERGVLTLFQRLENRYGWVPKSEVRRGPIVALRRGSAAITLEPGSQLELSGTPFPTLHDVVAEFERHLEELEGPSRELDITWLGVGFHPLAAQRDLDWVPKQRYPIMSEYLPTRGSGALDMMRRTATVQANFDYSSEEDAMRKVRTMLRLTPVCRAMLANSPLIEGNVSAAKSVRQRVWLRMDPSRSGIIDRLWTDELPTYADYVEWALDAGMFLFHRGGHPVLNTGQTFRSFMVDGFEGHYPTLEDWSLHLGTLFPEVRLKHTVEVRCSDALPRELTPAVPALFTGLLYDDVALAEAERLALRIELGAAHAAADSLCVLGLDAWLGGWRVRELAEEVLDIARRGLMRRAHHDAQGRDESTYLQGLGELVQRGASPSDLLLDRLAAEPLCSASVVRACAI